MIDQASTVAAMAALAIAFMLDRLLGEPPVRWHPVVWMGRYLDWAGRRMARRSALPGGEARMFAAGASAWCLGAALVTLLAWGAHTLSQPLAPLVAALLMGVLLKPLFAWRMLREEAQAVEAALSHSLEEGRARLARLVSRDVSQLDEQEVRESAIESLAENLCDSVVAPVFWFVVAGLPGAALYRFANTADAMWGYRGVRRGVDWTWAGKWAARADDVMSWIPARLSGVLIVLAGSRMALQRLRREAGRTPSPNSGWPMAAMALTLDVRLAKPGVYVLNGQAAGPGSADTARAVKVNARAVALLLAGAMAVLWGAQ